MTARPIRKQTAPSPAKPEGDSITRGRLKREAEQKHRKSCRWVGGILYFEATNEAVPGVAHCPKPGSPAIGLQAAMPAEVAKVTVIKQRGPAPTTRSPRTPVVETKTRRQSATSRALEDSRVSF